MVYEPDHHGSDRNCPFGHSIRPKSVMLDFLSGAVTMGYSLICNVWRPVYIYHASEN